MAASHPAQSDGCHHDAGASPTDARHASHAPVDTPAPWEPPRTYPKAGAVIKTYIQHAESRRTSSRFNTARPRPDHSGGGGGGDGARMVQSARASAADGGDGAFARDRSDVAAVAGLFAGKRKYSARQELGPAPPGAAPLAAAPATADPARHRLQPDLASLAMSPRPPPVVLGGARARHNLAAKLDTIARTSPWMRRRVIFGGDKGVRGLFRPLAAASPRRGGGPGGHVASGSASSGRAAGVGDSGSRNQEAAAEAEMEKRVMAAFSKIVRRWRERKKQSEQAAISIVHGQGGAGGPAPGAAAGSRFAPKLQRELDAQSSNVVSILSRRMIREVLALKFFDDTNEGDAGASADMPKGKARGPLASGGGSPASAKENGVSPSAAVAAKAQARGRVVEPPRGVCYTLDESGCRRVKMQSGVGRIGGPASSTSNNAAVLVPAHDKLEGISMEAAMGKSLRRKMARRVKSKRLTILKIGDSFEKSQQDMALKLSAKLALHQAESDKMFHRRMAVLCSDAAAAPPYLAQRELALARARVRKAALVEKCRTLYAVGAVLRRIENTGEMTGQDISAGELQFLEILRCIVETDQVLTPLLAEGVKQEFSGTQLEMPLVADLFRIFDHHVAGDQATIEEAWSNPTAASQTL